MILLPLLAQEPPAESTIPMFDWEGTVVTVDCKQNPELCVTADTSWYRGYPYGVKRIMDNVTFTDLDGAILLVEGHDRRYLLEIDRETGEMKLSEIKP